VGRSSLNTTAARPPSARILTVPNALSLVRLLCVPLFLWLLFAQERRVAAAGLLAVLGSTDWVDGYVARHFGQESELGKVLDPTADRIVLITAAISILVDGAIPVWIAVPVIIREVAVAITAVVLAAKGARRLEVKWIGKAATFALLVSLPLFLWAHEPGSHHDVVWTLALLCAIPGVIMSYMAAAAYVPAALDALRESRNQHAASDTRSERTR
jgi:cardiolipin synthase